MKWSPCSQLLSPEKGGSDKLFFFLLIMHIIDPDEWYTINFLANKSILTGTHVTQCTINYWQIRQKYSDKSKNDRTKRLEFSFRDTDLLKFSMLIWPRNISQLHLFPKTLLVFKHWSFCPVSDHKASLCIC